MNIKKFFEVLGILYAKRNNVIVNEYENDYVLEN